VARSRIDGGTARPSAVAVSAVHDHHELGRKLHREIARLLAAQNAINIGGGATKEVYRVGSVGDQTALSGIGRLVIDRWYVVSGRRRYDRRAMPEHESARHLDAPSSRLAPKGDNGRFDLGVAVNGRSDWLDIERAAAVSNEGIKNATGAASGLNMIAARLSPGAISESSSSHLPANVASDIWPKPVMLSRGWLSRGTIPLATGSAAFPTTIGIVGVSRWRATVGTVPLVKMMSGCKSTNSRASCRIRLMSPRPH
jgi:hypothetical protein